MVHCRPPDTTPDPPVKCMGGCAHGMLVGRPSCCSKSAKRPYKQPDATGPSVVSSTHVG